MLIGVVIVKTVEERLKEYEPLWENWTYSGEFLGQGAMSSVFEIESTAMGFKEIAALKIITIKKNHHGIVEIPKEAQNEIRILKELSNCPNIVHYHDSTLRKIYDTDNNVSEIDVLIKMEKLKPLSEDSNLSVKEVINLAKDMCNALIHASEHNIIHRDIKPQNIFVDENGVYKLGDFGIAKIVSDHTSRYTMNVGTLAYAAPEIHNNPSGTYDISSDIYSLGLVLYIYLNNGQLPFVNSAATLSEAITKRLSGSPFPSPENGNKMLKAIVMRACNKDIHQRYKTPQEMLEDLELLATGGKKLVVDPFATIDANLNLDESEINPDITVSPLMEERHDTLLTDTDDAKYKDTTNAGIRLMINMGKKSVDESDENTTATSEKRFFSTIPSKGETSPKDVFESSSSSTHSEQKSTLIINKRKPLSDEEPNDSNNSIPTLGEENTVTTSTPACSDDLSDGNELTEKTAHTENDESHPTVDKKDEFVEACPFSKEESESKKDDEEKNSGTSFFSMPTSI